MPLSCTRENVPGIWRVLGSPHHQPDWYRSSCVSLGLQGISFALYGTIRSLNFSLLSQSLLTRGPGSCLRPEILRYFLRTCHDGERSAHGLDTAKLYGNLNWMHSYDKSVQGVKSRIRLRRFLKYAPKHVSGSFLLQLIPMGLLWFTWFWMVIPTISLSLTFCKAYSEKSFTLARKCPTVSPLSEGGNNRTVSCVPTALYRLLCLLIVSSISNLRAMFLSLKKLLIKQKYLGSTHTII